MISILDAMDDANLFAPWFRDRNTWAAWCAMLAALFALPMTPEQVATYQQCTGRVLPPAAPATECWLVCGRRAGKSFVLALTAVYLACFREYRPHLAPGERATIMIIATDRRQARVIFRYVRGLLSNVPMLAHLIERETQTGFDLTNAVSIEIHVASFKSTRGYTIAAALCDEIAFWPSDDAADPDFAVLDALRPGMATMPGAMLLCASSPYARRGALWDAHRRWFGRDDAPALVWQAATRDMNPTVPERVIDEAFERDSSSAAAEYLAQFRSDIESYIAREAVEACVEPGVLERAPLARVRYSGFVDPSGGSADSMTIAIAHRDGGDAVLDAIRERRPPFSPEAVVAEFAALLKSYRITRISGDRYGGEFCREPFLKFGIKYEPSAKPKSDIYRDCLPLVNSGRVLLLDQPKLIAQLCGLERRVGRGGKDSIDHAPGGHDDLCNAACGALIEVSDGRAAYTRGIMNGVRGSGDVPTRWTVGQRILGFGRPNL